MIDRAIRVIITTAAKSAGVSPERIASAFASLEGAQANHRNNPAITSLLLTQADTARLLSCSRWSVKRLTDGGFLHPIRLRGLTRFKRTDIDQLLVDGTEVSKRVVQTGLQA